ncbi:MAG: D-alanyl-D-alanine carboxypeptidase [Bacteroidota bacterium]
MRSIFLVSIISTLAISCVSTKARKTIQEVKSLEEKFQDHVGFMLYDPFEDKVLSEYHSDKYFTPASNTKIFTLFTSLKIIGDTIPAFYYEENGDSLIFWGSGDPSLLYDLLPQHTGFNFLKSSDKELYFSNANFNEEHFGPGWAWDDYSYSFSVEISSLPIYGNRLTIGKKPNTPFLEIGQSFFKPYFSLGDSITSSSLISRDWQNNAFNYFPSTASDSFEEEIPFTTNTRLIASLLSDTLSREVHLINRPITDKRLIYPGIEVDSLYKLLMQDSDNFIAEQLLLMCSGLLTGELKTSDAIDYVKENYFKEIPDSPVWYDGSGLSRYNLFTPRSVVWLWDQLRKEVPQERLFSLLAVGGVSGTLEKYYSAKEPYVFGKTGTLSNNHSLSGFLITKKGKLLIFSLMNNNFPDKSAPVKRAMEKVLWNIHLNY